MQLYEKYTLFRHVYMYRESRVHNVYWGCHRIKRLQVILIFFLSFFPQFSGVFPPKLCTMNRNYFYYDKDNTKAGFFPPPTPPKKVLANILK